MLGGLRAQESISPRPKEVKHVQGTLRTLKPCIPAYPGARTYTLQSSLQKALVTALVASLGASQLTTPLHAVHAYGTGRFSSGVCRHLDSSWHRIQMSIFASMQRSNSSASLRSQETAGSKPRSAYRLFPAAESISTAGESHRRRSSSLDDATRTSAAVHRHTPRLSQLGARRDRERVPDLKPMSTVQELPLDSPTLPLRWTPRHAASSVLQEAGHGRSSSAPGESLQNARQALHARQQPLSLSNGHPAAPPKALLGLGLTLPPVDQNEQAIALKSAGRQETLHVEVRKQDSSPPPPPPKSPRHHSRNPSGRSRASSIQSPSFAEASPIVVVQTIAFTAAKPTSVHHAVSGAPSKTPPTTQEGQGSYFSRSVEALTKKNLGLSHSECRQTKQPSTQKPALLPLSSTSATAAHPRASFSPPSSKFSRGSPSRDLLAEGERTRRLLHSRLECYLLLTPTRRTRVPTTPSYEKT